MKHYSEDDLILYYYGELPKPADVERHLGECAACADAYRQVAGTLSLVVAPPVPERGDLYGLEVWQKIRHQLPAQEAGWSASWVSWRWLTLAGAAAAFCLIVAVAFVAGRLWSGAPAAPATIARGPESNTSPGEAAGSPEMNAARRRVLLASVADHLDRSDRVLTDIMNAPSGDISAEQRWADDLIATSRLYRQDAVAVGEQSVASVLDEIERSLVEIVHSPANVSAADLEQIRRRIDAAALLFKIRVLHEDLRGRETAPAIPRKTT